MYVLLKYCTHYLSKILHPIPHAQTLLDLKTKHLLKRKAHFALDGFAGRAMWRCIKCMTLTHWKQLLKNYCYRQNSTFCHNDAGTLVRQWWRCIKCMTLTLAWRPGRGNEAAAARLFSKFTLKSDPWWRHAVHHVLPCSFMTDRIFDINHIKSLTPENLWHSLCPWLQVVSFYSETEDQWIWYITAQKIMAHNSRNNPRNILSPYLWVNFSDDCWKWLSPVNLFLGPRKPFDNWRMLTWSLSPKLLQNDEKWVCPWKKLTAIQLLQCWKIEVFMQSESYETLRAKSCFYHRQVI